jgi:EmrB/QacA subfamily drug resistance transporter
MPHDVEGHPRRWSILAVLIVSMLMMIMDSTILNVALRTIADPVTGLGASQAQLEWIVNSYTLIFAGLLFTAGVIADRQGRKKVLVIGLIAFSLASLLATFVTSATQLVIMRVVMGAGGAFVMPTTLAIISVIFSNRERPKAIAVFSGAIGSSLALGPLLGGYLLDHFHWSSIFFINVPIGLATLVAVALIVPETRNPHPGRHDPVGVVMSIIGMVALCYGIIEGGERGFLTPLALAGMAGGVAVLVGFIFYEQRIDHPALDVHLFSQPKFSASIASIALVFFALMGVTFFSAFYLQSVKDLSPFQTGMMMIPLAVTQMIAAPFSTSIVHRLGVRRVVAAGASLMTLGIAVIGLYQVDSSLVLPAVNMGLMGIAFGLMMAPANAMAVSAVPREKMGEGSAISQTLRQVGSALGVAIAGSIGSYAYKANIAPEVARLPEQLREQVTASVQATLAFAEGTGVMSLADAAKQAYVGAMHVSAVVCVLVGMAGIFVALRWLPDDKLDHGAKPAESPATTATAIAEGQV